MPPPLCLRGDLCLQEAMLDHPAIVNKFGAMGGERGREMKDRKKRKGRRHGEGRGEGGRGKRIGGEREEQEKEKRRKDMR